MTRFDYIDGKVSHQRYYAQYVNKRIKNLVVSFFGKIPPKELPLDDLILCINRIPSDTAKQLVANNDVLDTASGISIVQEAARQLRNG